MNTAIYLNYVGLGSNLLHLAYCHQIADKYGPVTVITLCTVSYTHLTLPTKRIV